MGKKLDKKEYLALIKPRYQRASKLVKSQILNEFCATFDCNRKYAIALLSQPTRAKAKAKQKPGPKPRYADSALQLALKRIWHATDLMCSKRLKAAIPHWLPFYQTHYELLSSKQQEALLQISPASIDRILKPIRDKLELKRRCTTRPGSLLQTEIPIKTHHWDVIEPGYVEADTVAHCGDTLVGDFAWSITVTDICSCWTEIRATWNKGATGVISQIQDIEKTLPFALLGFDSDNGAEFLNWTLFDYFKKHDPPVMFTRSRPYHKNDNAHVEQKNWTHVRHLFGYIRFGKEGVVDLMNDLYKNEWRAYQNFFMPNFLLFEKQKIDHRYRRKYKELLTPCQRLLNHESISKKQKDLLIEEYYSLDPFVLKKQIEAKVKHIRQFLGFH